VPDDPLNPPVDNRPLNFPDNASAGASRVTPICARGIDRPPRRAIGRRLNWPRTTRIWRPGSPPRCG